MWYLSCLARRGGICGLVLLAGLATGCGSGHEEGTGAARSAGGPLVHVVKPELRNVTYTLDTPGRVDAFEQTSIFAKVSGFIDHFDADIGQVVKQGDLLAKISVPELDEEHQLKVAQVGLEKSNVKMAEAQVTEAKANVGKYQADVIRWESEVKRLTQMVKENVVDKQVLAETQRQLDSSIAAKKAAEAAVAAREADRLTAEARVKVAEADERKAAAMLDYTKVTAPYDSVVTVRNANRGDYVQAVTGDKSTANPSAIFVVVRVDMLRIFVDVPEDYAPYVQKGTKAMVRADALSGVQIPATVTRTSWAIRENIWELRAEIDLSIKEYDGLRPGRYVTAKVFIERPNVYALPQHSSTERTLTEMGNQTYCYLLRGGKAVKTSVKAGISDGTWTEVDQVQIDGTWRKVTGKENVILGDLSELTDGQAVTVAEATAP